MRSGDEPRDRRIDREQGGESNVRGFYHGASGYLDFPIDEADGRPRFIPRPDVIHRDAPKNNPEAKYHNHA